MQLARIVTVPPGDNGMTLTQGTKVMVDGIELQGITSITLHCEVNDVWRATIEAHVQPPADLAAIAFIHYPAHWDRLRVWLRRLVRRD